MRTASSRALALGRRASRAKGTSGCLAAQASSRMQAGSRGPSYRHYLLLEEPRRKVAEVRVVVEECLHFGLREIPMTDVVALDLLGDPAEVRSGASSWKEGCV